MYHIPDPVSLDLATLLHACTKSLTDCVIPSVAQLHFTLHASCVKQRANALPLPSTLTTHMCMYSLNGC